MLERWFDPDQKQIIIEQYGTIDRWNVSNVTDMSNLFEPYATSFNENITPWNVSNVINMSGMFTGCILFNRDISSWDVSSVNDMSSMFFGAESFTGVAL